MSEVLMALDESADYPDDDPVRVTELDVEPAEKQVWVAELADEEMYQELQAQYWQEVRDCCGGRVWGCVHWRSYPPPVEREEP